MKKSKSKVFFKTGFTGLTVNEGKRFFKKTKKEINEEKSLFVGLDPSITATGYAIFNKQTSTAITSVLNTDTSDSSENRIISIWSQLKKEIFDLYEHKIDTVGIEGIAFGSRGQRMYQLAGLHYYLRIQLCLKFFTLPLFEIPPSSIKKFVTGKGQIKKNLMLLKCYQKFGFETDSDDICDAYCIARYLATYRR